MTREEEIRQASIEYTCKDRPMCIGGGTFSEMVDEMNRNHAFEEGAQWADKTMIERACKWLFDNAKYYILVTGGGYWFNNVGLSENFKKAMKE